MATKAKDWVKGVYSAAKPGNEPHETIDKDGRAVLVYPDGGVKEQGTGHWIIPAKQYQITPENSQLRKDQRRALNQAAAEEGIIEALKQGKKFRESSTGADAIRVIAREITKIAMNGKHDRDRIDAADKVLKWADLLPRENLFENTTNILNVDPETAQQIVALVQQLAGGAQAGKVIDGEVKELQENDRN